MKTFKAGRVVVLPKAIRDRIGFKERANLELKGAFLVHTGQKDQGFDVLQVIAWDREERDREILGNA